MGPAAGSTPAAWYQRLLERPSVITTFAEYAAAASRMPATVEALQDGIPTRRQSSMLSFAFVALRACGSPTLLHANADIGQYQCTVDHDR